MAKLGREATKRRGRAPKEAAIGEVVTTLEKGAANGFLLFNNKGLTLAQFTAFRKKMRGEQVKVRVIKNTLLKIAIERSGVDPKPLESLLTGTTVLVVGMEDPVTPAKLLFESAKDNEKIEIKGGYLDGKVMDVAGVEQLSKLPGREELLGRMLSSLMSPVQNLVYALNDGVSKPVYVLDAIRRKKEEEEGSAA